MTGSRGFGAREPPVQTLSGACNITKGLCGWSRETEMGTTGEEGPVGWTMKLEGKECQTLPCFRAHIKDFDHHPN